MQMEAWSSGIYVRPWFLLPCRNLIYLCSVLYSAAGLDLLPEEIS